MAKPEPKKRQLKFDDLNAMLADAKSLHENGYVSNGNWTLGQCCGHLGEWMRYPMDGFPVPPLPIRAIFWVMKKTIVPGMKRKILENGFSSGMMTAPESVAEASEISDEQGLQQLADVIERAKTFSGSLHDSPLFGKMDEAMWKKITVLHGEHHLGFLEPESTAAN